MAKTHLGICNFCDASCGLEITHEEGRILGIRGDALNPFSRQHAGVSMNDLTDERAYDRVSGTTVLDGVPVTIALIGENA